MEIAGIESTTNVNARQIAVTFRETYQVGTPLTDVIQSLHALLWEEEQSVRLHGMDQLCEIATFCHEEGEPLRYVISDYIVPDIVELLMNRCSQMRKSARAVILSLTERGVISRDLVQAKFIPLIVKMFEDSTVDDTQPDVEVISFLCKLAPVVGKDVVVKSYLFEICSWCDHFNFQVRRACASGIGDIAPVLGVFLTEKAIIPRFLCLCGDVVWNVRRSCGESFTSLAAVCSYHIRSGCLTSAYIDLLEDHSRWVKLSATRNLGQFISTFLQREGSECDATAVEVIPSSEEAAFLESIRILDNRECKLKSKVVRTIKRQDPVEQDSKDNSGCGDNGKLEPDSFLKFWLVDRENKLDETIDMQDNWDDWMDYENKTDKLFQDNIRLLGETWKNHIPDEMENDENEDEGNGETIVDTETDKHQATLIPPISFPNSIIPDSEVDMTDEATSPSNHTMSTISTQSHNDPISIHVEESSVNGILCNSPPSPVSTDSPSSNSISSTGCSTDESKIYNAFHYWRIPIPDIELDVKLLLNGKAKKQEPSRKIQCCVDNVTAGVEDKSDGTMDLDKSFTNEGIDDHELEADPIQSVESASEEAKWQNEGFRVIDMAAKGKTEESDDEKWKWDPPQEAFGQLEDVHRSYYNLYSVSSPEKTEGEDDEAVESGSPKRLSFIEVKYQRKVHSDRPDNSLFEVHKDDYFLSCLYGDGSGHSEHNDCLTYNSKVNGPFGERGTLLPLIETNPTVGDQETVNPILLSHFIKMAEETYDSSMSDNEMPSHCAFSFPAVVMTLGRENWPILRDCFERLAIAFEWKTRHTLGSSLHEIAKIIGPEFTERDLLPFYEAVTKDVDEVRMGILCHLADFAKILTEPGRILVLSTLPTFLLTENRNNWRFRFELASQLAKFVDMFDDVAVYKKIRPIAMELAIDPIADVRRESLRVIAKQIAQLNLDRSKRVDTNSLRDYVFQVVDVLCQSSKWCLRQSFATLSSLLISSNALEPHQFAQDILPHLLSLSTDKVPNVRLVVAQTLSSQILIQDYFADPSNPHHPILMDTIQALRHDPDSDVRYYSQGAPESEN